jgi:hypothetical protein
MLEQLLSDLHDKFRTVVLNHDGTIHVGVLLQASFVKQEQCSLLKLTLKTNFHHDACGV